MALEINYTFLNVDVLYLGVSKPDDIRQTVSYGVLSQEFQMKASGNFQLSFLRTSKQDC